MDNLKDKARNLRNNMTEQEWKLWLIIRNRQFYGHRFLRQYVIGDYIVDFVCKKAQIIIEIDGSQHNETNNLIYDKKRTEYLENKGYRVYRFWNNEVDNDIEGVYQKLQEIFNVK